MRKIFQKTHFDPIIESFIGICNSSYTPTALHTHDFYEFLLVTKGELIHHINYNKKIIHEGTLIFIRPDDVHEFIACQGKQYEFINIPYSKKAVHSAITFLENGFDINKLIMGEMPSTCFLNILDKERLKSLVGSIRINEMQDKYHARTHLRSLLIELVTLFLTQSKQHQKIVPQWLEQLMHTMQLRENFIEGLSRMYSLAHCTPNHLHKIMKKYYQVTPVSYINQLRISYAKELLTTTQLPIIEIAFICGFENLSHFYHNYKKIVATTPLMTRKQVLR